MGALEGKVAVITGAGRGIGRAHALLFASEGARVVVNDLGCSVHGVGDDLGAAHDVVDEIKRLGGEAVANTDDVSDWEGGHRVVTTAIETFGDLHILVNNAGIIRDRVLVNMTEEEWDVVLHANVNGHLVPTRWAATYWREQAKSGARVRAAVVNTSSTSGLLGNPGQSNYGTAKAGIAAMTVIAAQELSRYGVRVNAIVPAARSRITESTPGIGDIVQPPSDPEVFDSWDPGNVSPVVAYLASDLCPFTGKVFFVQGGMIQQFQPWSLGAQIDKGARWSVEELAGEMPKIVGTQPVSPSVSKTR